MYTAYLHMSIKYTTTLNKQLSTIRNKNTNALMVFNVGNNTLRCIILDSRHFTHAIIPKL